MHGTPIALAIITGAFLLAGTVKGVIGMGVPAFAGMFLGQAIRTRIHPDVFRRWFFAWLLLIGLYMAGRAAAA